MSDMRVGAINSLEAVSDWLKILSGNLTGSVVNGYRETNAEFGDVLADSVQGAAPATNNIGSTNPLQFNSSGATLTGTVTDFNQGNIQTTGIATNLAVNGDALFVLSKVPNPTSMSDLVFTRNGDFHFETDLQGSGKAGTYRLVNEQGYFVMGVQGNFAPSAQANVPGQTTPPPQEIVGAGAAFPQGLVPIEVPFDTNPTAGFNQDFAPQFNGSGELFDPSTDEPFLAGATGGGTNGHLPLYVALMKFSNPEGLTKDTGSSVFSYDPIAGTYFAGVAQNPQNATGPVSHDNTIVPNSLENSNSSVNTTLPELTIAQKSFTANVKIVQVGNELIDDVVQLIR